MVGKETTPAASRTIYQHWSVLFVFGGGCRVDKGKTKLLCVKTQAEDDFLLCCPRVNGTQIQSSLGLE